MPEEKSLVTYNSSWMFAFRTVSNIQNLFIHEYLGHGYPNYFDDKTKTHYKAYELQMQHPTWHKTTEGHKEHILGNYERYLRNEK